MPPPATPDPSSTALAGGLTLLLGIVVLGMLLVGMTIALFAARRRSERRSRPPRKGTSTAQPDPWAEAARRAVPIEPDPDLPADDDIRPGPDPNDETRGWT